MDPTAASDINRHRGAATEGGSAIADRTDSRNQSGDTQGSAIAGGAGVVDISVIGRADNITAIARGGDGANISSHRTDGGGSWGGGAARDSGAARDVPAHRASRCAGPSSTGDGGGEGEGGVERSPAASGENCCRGDLGDNH